MKNLKNKIVNLVKNRKAASMMEFFVITLIVLLIAAAVFALGNIVRGGVNQAGTKSTELTTTMTNGVNFK